MSNQINRRIIVIDDNGAIHEDFRKILAARKRADSLNIAAAMLFGDQAAPAEPSTPTFELDHALQGEEGYNKVKAAVERDERFALAFVDMRMPPGWDGLQTIEKLWEVDPSLQIVICSAYSDYSWADIIQRFGVVDRLLILKKPFDTAEVCQLACSLTEKWHLAKYASLKLSQLQSMVEEQTTALKTEIMERQRSETALRSSEDRYALAVAAANDGLWDWDLQNDTVFYSVRWKAMFGYGEQEIGITPAEWFDRVHPEDMDALRQELSDHLEAKTASLECEYRAKGRDGNYLWMLCRGLSERDATGKAVRIAGSQADITNRRMAEEQLRHDATHDVLTGLSNRAVLTDHLRRCIARSARNSGLFAVLFLDLDRFKIINDSLGHGIGDALLIGIANRLKTCVREEDSLVRLGGDEFVLLLETISDAADAVRVAERVHKTFVLPFSLQGNEIFSSCSIGIAIGSAAYSSSDDILRDADTALYQSKSAGKGCYHVFEHSMHATVMSQLKMENELRHALDRGEFCLHYQPVASLATGEITGLEALIRWQHPERGLLSPSEFISIAEESGVIVGLGNWVLREACLQFKRFELEFPWMSSLSLAVNVSGRQFNDSRFVAEVETVLKTSGLQPDRLHLEITETSAMEGAATTAEILCRLNNLKVQLHVDDFGTGYSSLSYLHRMPVDALKVDRSFVGSMSTDELSRSIVQTIVTLAHTLKLKVVGEGAETQEHVDQLKSVGCDYAQGYFWSRPLAAGEIIKFLASRGDGLLERAA